jgi:SynChlorMet cassette protein ScmC
LAEYFLPLHGGAGWVLRPEDAATEEILDEFASVLRLSPPPVNRKTDPARTVSVAGGPPAGARTGIWCDLSRTRPADEIPFLHFALISHALARGLLSDGGLLLHGALAEFRPDGAAGRGVVFSASGGTGKSTASRRLSGRWRSLSDDASLVLPDGSGGYRAHPWPTWSAFASGGPGGTWDVPSSVPLRACVFLKQAPGDALEPLGRGQAAGLLVESSQQINALDRRLPSAEKSRLALARFDSACGLAQAVSAFLLRISLEGEFWREVERVLA